MNNRRRPSPSRPVRAATAAPRTLAPRPRSKHDPSELAAIAELGYALYLADRFDEARVVFEGLHSIAPENAYYLRGLSETFLVLGDHPAALRSANGVVALEPKAAASFLLRGRVLLAAERGADARNDLMRAARLGDELAVELLRL